MAQHRGEGSLRGCPPEAAAPYHRAGDHSVVAAAAAVAATETAETEGTRRNLAVVVTTGTGEGEGPVTQVVTVTALPPCPAATKALRPRAALRDIVSGTLMFRNSRTLSI